MMSQTRFVIEWDVCNRVSHTRFVWQDVSIGISQTRFVEWDVSIGVSQTRCVVWWDVAIGVS